MHDSCFLVQIKTGSRLNYSFAVHDNAMLSAVLPFCIRVCHYYLVWWSVYDATFIIFLLDMQFLTKSFVALIAILYSHIICSSTTQPCFLFFTL